MARIAVLNTTRKYPLRSLRRRMTDTKNPEELEFYNASVNAWYNSSLEHDKSLLTLSAGGIGLLITLLTTVGLKSFFSLALYVMALVCFIACLISVLLIFKGNKGHIVKLFNGEDFDNPYLEKLDKVAMQSFVLGVIFSAIIGVTTAHQRFIETKDKTMTDNKSTPGTAMDSFNGAQLLQKSFTGAHQLKPAPSTNSNGTQNSQSSTSQQAATTSKTHQQPSSEKKN